MTTNPSICARCGGPGANEYSTQAEPKRGQWQHHLLETCIEHLIMRTEAAENSAASNRLALWDEHQKLLAAETRIAELEAQLATTGWQPITEEWPPMEKGIPVLMKNGKINFGYRYPDRSGYLWKLMGGRYAAEAVTHASELPQPTTQKKIKTNDEKL